MIREVRVAAAVFEKAQIHFPETRSAQGAPSEYDFVGGPLAASAIAAAVEEQTAVLAEIGRTATQATSH